MAAIKLDFVHVHCGVFGVEWGGGGEKQIDSDWGSSDAPFATL